jgi:hypothetical protein
METAELPQDQTLTYAPPASAKLLLRVVYIMGIILVLLFLLLVGGIIWKATKKGEAVVPPVAAALDLMLPAGASVQSMELDGDRLAVHTGSEIIIIDVRKNVIVSRIATIPK